MERPEYKYGIYGGIAVCLFKIIEFLPVFQKTRIESDTETGLLALVIVAAVIILGVKYKRNNNPKGTITFLQAFTTGMIIAVFIAVLTIPFIYMYGKFINPDEADKMIEYVKMNPGDYIAPEPQELYNYYAPRHRSMETGENILITGFVVALFSAGMFRRVPTTEQDFVDNAELPLKVRRFFTISILFTALPLIIYLLWLLKWGEINSWMFEILSDPLDSLENPIAMQEGTAFLSLAAFILNILSYNRIAAYRHPLNVWNMRMLLVSIVSFLISLWLILHAVHF